MTSKTIKVILKNLSGFTGQCSGTSTLPLTHALETGCQDLWALLGGDGDMKGPQQPKPPDINV